MAATVTEEIEGYTLTSARQADGDSRVTIPYYVAEETSPDLVVAAVDAATANRITAAGHSLYKKTISITECLSDSQWRVNVEYGALDLSPIHI